jgi:hypothetical protein
MSGGYFGYSNYQMNDMIDSIERLLNKQGKLKDKSELYMGDDYYVKYPEELYNITYSKEVQEKLIEGIKSLKIASVYTKRIDWFLSDDDGEDNFLSRLEDELNKINREYE